MDKHEMMQALRNMALEMGRTPTKPEFCTSVKGGDYKVNKLFGGWTPFMSATGLETYDERRAPKARKIDNGIFERDIEKHLEQYQPRVVADLGPFPTMAVISDIHWPFSCQRVIDKFYAYVEANQPEWVILNGDAWDMYSHAKFPRSHNVFTPREEQQMARAANEDFWKEIKRLAPNAKCVQMLGNHDVRPLKRIMDNYPEAEDWIAEKMRDLFSFEGVHTMHDPREELFIREDIIVFHGFRTQLGAHRDSTLLSCINGHTHRGGVVFKKVRGGAVLWEANSGYAGDPEAKGLTYTAQKLTDWTHGFFGMDAYGPRFVIA